MVSNSGIITTFAGTNGVSGSTGDGGAPTSCLFLNPTGIAVDSSNRVYVTDLNKVRVISTMNLCSAGSYMSTLGTCTFCPTGSYSASSSSATSCALCLVNTYMSSTGATVCTPCPTGTTSFVLGATSATRCTVRYDMFCP